VKQGLASVTQQSPALVTPPSKMQPVAGKTGHREVKEEAMFAMSKRLFNSLFLGEKNCI
jgi:hypothetical protein